MENRTFYEILNCNQDATYDELKKSYHNLILQYHPDKQSHHSVQSKEFIAINEAWEVLRNIDKRRTYDAELLQAEFNENPIVYEILVTGDFIFDAATGNYSYTCRCGGTYNLPPDSQQDNSACYIGCDECSLVVQLRF